MTQRTSQSPSNRLVIILGGCAVLAACLCLLAAALGGGYYFWQRQPLAAQAEPAVEYILDASPRMNLPLEDGTRLSTARAVLGEVVRPADPGVIAGLRVFGTGAVAEACSDTDLLVPLAPSNQAQIADMAFGLEAGSAADAALAEAMLAAIRDLAATAGPHTLVVITGGVDSCNDQAGQLIRQEAEKAGINLQEFVIGLAVEPAEAEAIKGLVAESGGQYFDAPDSNTLANILIAIQNHIDNPTASSLQTIQTAATPGAVVVQNTLQGGGPTPVVIDPGGDPTSSFTLPGIDTYVSQSACDHPYFPIRSGASWQYSSDGYGYTWVINSVSGDLASATANISSVFDLGTVTYDWACTSDGVSWFTGGTITTEGASGTMTVTEMTGASLLSGPQLAPGATWASSYTTIYTSTIDGQEYSTTSTTSETHTAGALQSLTTELGTFDVLPVTSNSTYTSTVLGQTFTSSGVNTIYFAYGIGIIRMESSGEGYSTTTVLVSYSIP